MPKFAIECPKCGSINTASTFIFAKKVIQCATCGEEIDIKASRLISKICPNCGKTFVFDQAHSKNKKCPACGETIDLVETVTAHYKMVRVNCPQCACSVEVDKTAVTSPCPICGYQIQVEKELEKAHLVTDSGVSVIQYEGDNTTFVWKHPIEDFNLGSQLIVHESQEAIFFLNGQALDTFGPGRHTLETENIPILKKIYDLPTGTQTPFHAEVYFINKAVHMGLKWGTDSRVRFTDPTTGIPLDIGASGEMNLAVSDSRKLVVKLVGTTGGLTDKQILSASSDESGKVHRTLQSYFRAPLMTAIKSYLGTTIREQKINLLQIDEKMGEMSEALKNNLMTVLEEYGLCIPQFYITHIALPEDDPNFQRIKSLISERYLGVQAEEVKASVAEAARQRKIVEEQTEAQLRMIRAQSEAEAEKAKGLSEAEVMRAKGYSEKDILQAEVQKAYAEGMGKIGGNGGGSGGGNGVTSDLIGMMAGMKMAGKMFDMMDEKTSSSDPAPDRVNATWSCSCGETKNAGKFCMSCGKQKPETASGWTCPGCGKVGLTGKFCTECGAKKPDETWDCSCGCKNITGNFCPDCGNKKV